MRGGLFLGHVFSLFGQKGLQGLDYEVIEAVQPVHNISGLTFPLEMKSISVSQFIISAGNDDQTVNLPPPALPDGTQDLTKVRIWWSLWFNTTAVGGGDMLQLQEGLPGVSSLLYEVSLWTVGAPTNFYPIIGGRKSNPSISGVYHVGVGPQISLPDKPLKIRYDRNNVGASDLNISGRATDAPINADLSSILGGLI